MYGEATDIQKVVLLILFFLILILNIRVFGEEWKNFKKVFQNRRKND